MTKIKPLTIAIRTVLLFGASSLALSNSVLAEESDNSEQEAEESEKIVVTGSRIKRNEIEGAAPITVITADDIEKRGFTTVFEALGSLSQFTGTTQDDQFSGGFTQAANSLDLRGLGPGRSLILLDGRRITDYPLPFNGQSNIVNLANIPSVMIERIEVLSSGASAIYGSDAVAGVVNIILKKDLESDYVSVRYGEVDRSQGGGGESGRFQFAADGEVGGFNFIAGLEYFKRQPIYAFERDFQDSFLDDPTLESPEDVVNSRTFLSLGLVDFDGDGFSYNDPGSCTAAQQALYGGTVEYSFRPDRGNYCGTNESVGYFTIRNGRENTNLYGSWDFDLGSDMELFGTVIYQQADTEFDTGGTFYNPSTGGDFPDYFLNTTSPDVAGIGGGQIELWQRIFAPEEVGGLDARLQQFEEEVFNVVVGFRSQIGEFDFETFINHSEYDSERSRRVVVASAADDFFLGQSTGDVVVDLSSFVGAAPGTLLRTVPAYAADVSRLYTPLTEAEYNSISTIDFTQADSSQTQVAFVLSGELGELDAGPIGFAAIAEYGMQDYNITLEDDLVNGVYFGLTGTGGGGDRDRAALGAEVSIPVLSTLQLNLAARYDNYDDITSVDDATTYNAGIEYRPFDSFLARASFSSSFRAPDMHFVFADDSGFFTTTDDQYLCRRDEPDVNILDCTNSGVGISGTRAGNPGLEEEEADSFTVGFVWDVMENLTISADLYQIDMSNVVSDLSIANLMQTEADCRLGQTEGGVPVDINTAECQDAISRITRNPILDGAVTSEVVDAVVVGPINQATVKTKGIDAALTYLLSTDDLGDFRLNVGYSHVLAYETQEFAEDPVQDIRDNLQNFDLRSRANASFGWSRGDWDAQISAFRLGSVPNWAETARCCVYTTYNLSVRYNVMEDLRVGLFVQNLRDSTPNQDPTFDSYPYYSQFVYDPYGRELFLQAEYSFDLN